MLAQAPLAPLAPRAVEVGGSSHPEAGDSKTVARMRAARQQAAAGAIMKRKILRIAQVSIPDQIAAKIWPFPPVVHSNSNIMPQKMASSRFHVVRFGGVHPLKRKILRIAQVSDHNLIRKEH
jgi:hypothetical protein